MDADLSLVSLSGVLDVSPNHLSACIKKYAGETFINILIRKRMEAARELLSTTQLKVQEVARRCGYTDQHYFSYCFKKYCGESPNAMRRRLSRKGRVRGLKGCVPEGLRTTTILVSMVVGVVAIILCCCILLFLDRYRSAMVQSARTSTAQAVSQVSNTVGSYLRDMEQAMDLVERSMAEPQESRDELLSAFLHFRPDVVAVTSYSEDGELLDCWSLGREPREDILQNLSFDLVRARASDGPYMTAPHVESIFESYYPWVVTMTAPLEPGGEAAWVSLDLSFSSISSHINNVGIGQRGYCFLMDREGNIVYHPQQQLLYAGLKSEDTAALAALADGTYADDTVIYAVTSVEDSAGGWWASAMWTSWSTAACGR